MSETRAFVFLGVLPETVADIKSRLLESGYAHCVKQGPAGEFIDLQGIAIAELPPPERVEVTVNGTRIVIPGAPLTYEALGELAAGHPAPHRYEQASATYFLPPRAGRPERSGILCRGRSVRPEEGMSFTIVNTGSA